MVFPFPESNDLYIACLEKRSLSYKRYVCTLVVLRKGEHKCLNAKFLKHYEGAVKPFQIIGNVYFVGCIPASSHLIDTGDGLILIDTGYEDTLFMLVDSVYRLGFQLSDMKYIIHTHWHGDHTAATAGLVALTGAKTFIGYKDAEKAKAYFPRTPEDGGPYNTLAQ